MNENRDRELPNQKSGGEDEWPEKIAEAAHVYPTPDNFDRAENQASPHARYYKLGGLPFFWRGRIWGFFYRGICPPGSRAYRAGWIRLVKDVSFELRGRL